MVYYSRHPASLVSTFCLNGHEQARHHLHRLQVKTAILTHIWSMDTNNCGELQPGGKGQEPSWPPVNAPTPLLWRNESGKRPGPGLVGNSELPAVRLCHATAQYLHQPAATGCLPFSIPVGKKKAVLTNGNKKVATGSHGRSTKVVREFKFTWTA